MSYQGDIRLGDTIGFKFTTRQVSGAPFTLAGTPVISAYPAGSNAPITAGITLTVDYPKTGLNDVSIVASNGNGFAAGTNYDVVVTTGTVNGVSVIGEVVGSFSIANRSALMPATAGRTLAVDSAGLADANTVKVGPTGTGTAQTARDLGGTLGAAGAGLTALGDTRIANLDATVSSRSTFAGGAVASVSGSVGSVATDVGITQAGADKVWGSAARTLTSFGTLVADTATAVWGAATRLLTAGTNIVLAKGTGLTGLNDIAATSVVSGGAITTSGGVASADVKKVNAVTVDGTGTDIDPWGPV